MIYCFRPLSGSYISQLDRRLGGPLPHQQVSVPYRGATFLNIDRTFLMLQAHTVSVPYRGATFLNTIPATPCPVWDE